VPVLWPNGRTLSVVLVYKILLPPEWAAFAADGRFDGSPFDVESGYIHCSSREQVARTAARYFANEPTLVIVALDTESLGDTVRWEESSDGDRFPHVYGPLPLDAVASTYDITGPDTADATLPS
jgi:uncharacterized protein (DUF952 family)